MWLKTKECREKMMFVLSSSLRIPDPCLCFKSPRPLSPPLGTLDFLSICIEIDSLTQKKSYDQPRQHIKKQRHYFANKGPSSQSCGFSSSHVWMWGFAYKVSWAMKNWCFWTVVLEKTLESPLDSKEIQPVHPKGDQSWIFTGRTDAEAETPILWPPDGKNWLWKRPWCWNVG